MQTTVFLRRIRSGDRTAQTELLAHIYDELHAMARGYMRRERTGHTLEATDLANEAVVRICKRLPHVRDGRHLRALLRRAMHNWLIDCARRRETRERAQPALVSAVKVTPTADLYDLALAIDALRAIHPRAARVVQHRCYLGHTIAETARYLCVSHGTVEADFTFARAYLFDRLRHVA